MADKPKVKRIAFRASPCCGALTATSTCPDCGKEMK